MPVLLVILQIILGTSAAPASLAAISLAQWVTIGEAMATAGPEVVNAIQALHPIFAKFIGLLETSHDIGHAAASVMQTLKANGEAAIKLQPGISQE